VTPLTITFTAPTANATVSGTTPISASAAGGTGLSYKLAVDGTQVATAASLSWNTTTATNGSHTLTASVTDALNRTATTTRTVTVSNAATTPAPTGTLSVAVTQPTNGTTVNGTNWAVAWVSGAASGTATYTLSAGGKTVGTATSTPVGPVSVPWNTALVADGTQTLTMSVRDSAGNTGSASVSVTVKNNTATTVVPTAAVTTTLQVGVTQPTAGSTVNGTNWAVVWVTGAAAGNATYTLTAGGKTVGSTSASPTGAVSVAWDTTLVADGSQTLTVSVRDSAGNAGSTSVSVNVKNSTTPTGTLSVAITQPTNSATVSGTAWVVMWAGGTSGTSNTFTLAVDGQTVATQTGASAGPVTLPWTTSSSGNGTHTVTATVSDATGNTGTNTISVTVAN
jgi:hypothetical protein